MLSCIHEEGKPMSAAWSLEDFHKKSQHSSMRMEVITIPLSSINDSIRWSIDQYPSVVYIRWWKLKKKHFQIPRQLCIVNLAPFQKIAVKWSKKLRILFSVALVNKAKPHRVGVYDLRGLTLISPALQLKCQVILGNFSDNMASWRNLPIPLLMLFATQDTRHLLFHYGTI